MTYKHKAYEFLQKNPDMSVSMLSKEAGVLIRETNKILCDNGEVRRLTRKMTGGGYCDLKAVLQ